jgi:pseudouridine synthase
MERLQKILSQAGIASRRAAERLIVDGRVTVNGVTVRTLGTKADAAHDDIRVDGRRVRIARRRRYILLNKPRGYVTTRVDPQRRPTVIDLLTESRALTPGEYVYPVGRLDFDSEGLLLLTNDGDLAARMTHPSHEVARVYEVQVLGIPDERDLDRLRRGIVLDGRRTAPAEISLHARPHRSANDAETGTARLEITIREGRNRQVRRMCETIGHPVARLRRIAIGPLRDPRLKPGEWRELRAHEIASLHVTQRTPRTQRRQRREAETSHDVPGTQRIQRAGRDDEDSGDR